MNDRHSPINSAQERQRLLATLRRRKYRIPMAWEDALVKILESEFGAAQAKNARFSKRMFAKKLGISISTLSGLLRRRQKVSRTRAIQIIEKLRLKEEVRHRYLMMLEASVTLENMSVEPSGIPELADWRHRFVYLLHELEAPGDAREIGRRLALAPAQVQIILEELVRLGLLIKIDDRNFELNPEPPAFASPTKAALRQFHRANLELAAASVDRLPHTRGHFSSFVFTGSEEQMAEVQAEILKVFKKSRALFASGPPKDLFQLSVQFFKVDFSD